MVAISFTVAGAAKGDRPLYHNIYIRKFEAVSSNEITRGESRWQNNRRENRIATDMRRGWWWWWSKKGNYDFYRRRRCPLKRNINAPARILYYIIIIYRR